MHGHSILAALQRHQNSLEAEIARLVPDAPPDAGELLEAAALAVAQAKKLLGAEITPGMRGDLEALADWAEAIATSLFTAARKLREAERLIKSKSSDGP